VIIQVSKAALKSILTVKLLKRQNETERMN